MPKSRKSFKGSRQSKRSRLGTPKKPKRSNGSLNNLPTPAKVNQDKSIVRGVITAVKPNEPEKLIKGYYTIINFTIPRDPTLYVAKGIYLGIWENRIYLGTYELDPRPPWTQSDPYQIPLSEVIGNILQMPTEGPFASILSFSDTRHGRSIQETKRAKNENDKRRSNLAEAYGLSQRRWNDLS
jgi:hypothetical protein